MHLDEHDQGQHLNLRVGQSFDLSLPENPTTGFRWQLDLPAATGCVVVHDAFMPQTDRHGQGGMHQWQFEAQQVGQGIITLIYRRSWQSNDAAARMFTLDVVVAM